VTEAQKDRIPVRIVRVLYLDHFPFHEAWPQERGLRLDMTLESSWDSKPYDCTPENAEAIARLTTSRHFDVIVLGNNLGAGARKAQFIAPNRRSKVIVVYNGEPHHIEQYKQLGIHHFSDRLKLWPVIAGWYTN